ncbi:MAG: hypothetical protein GX307_01895 [Euryarchaeota archaeon]|nr:hypothetical protein [Euryarchaeota archaeon]
MLALGIDVGGTYTDGVLFDTSSGEVLGKAKVRTIKDNLSDTILRCFSALRVAAPAMLSRFCISTTLATNAIVEGTRKDVCAICIGFTPTRAIDYACETAIIKGRHDSTGQEVQPIDLIALRDAVARSDRDSFAISGYFGTRNPGHENMASQEVLRERPLATVVKGSDLVGILGAEERLFLAAKNAELVHLMKDFISSLGAMTKIPDAVTYVLKGDGTLVSTEEALLKPIFTVLSGPAASAMGGIALAQVQDALVIDIGGTTTDIALLDGGRVRTSEEGAVVGGARLRTGSVDMTTVALGGDTEICCSNGRPVLGERAVGPLCLAPDAGRIMRDRSFLFPQSGNAFAITPTDFFLASGQCDFGERSVEIKALDALAEECHMPTPRLYGIIEETIRSRLLRAIVSALLGKTIYEEGEGDALLKGNGLLRPVLRIGRPIVGVGAPVHHFLDLIVDWVDCEIIIPPHYEIGNAVGTVCTEVYGKKEIIVRGEPRFWDNEEVISYHVTIGEGQRIFSNKEKAIEFAIDAGKAALDGYMMRSRVKRYDILVERKDIVYVENGMPEYVETIITVSAGGV